MDLLIRQCIKNLQDEPKIQEMQQVPGIQSTNDIENVVSRIKMFFAELKAQNNTVLEQIKADLEENGKKAEYLNRLQAQAETMEDQQKKLSENISEKALLIQKLATQLEELKKQLEDRGYEVYMTRDNKESDLSESERAKNVNASEKIRSMVLLQQKK